MVFPVKIARHFEERLKERCGITLTKQELAELTIQTKKAVDAYPDPQKYVFRCVLELDIYLLERGLHFIGIFLETPRVLVTAFLPGHDKAAARKAKRERNNAFQPSKHMLRRKGVSVRH